MRLITGGGGEPRALILNQHPLWLDALQQLLDRIGIDVVGKTSSVREALALVRTQEPDLLVADLELWDGEADGLEALRQAVHARPALACVALSAVEDAAHVERAFDAGASVYAVKRARKEDLAAAMRQALDRSVYFAVRTPPPGGTSAAPAARLTKRERELLELLAEGYSNAQLAKILWVTEQTVKFHLSNIYRKLGVANRTEAGRWAQVHGLLRGGVQPHPAG